MSELNTQLEAAEIKLAELRSQLEILEQQVALEDERVSLLRRLLELDAPPRPPSSNDVVKAPSNSARSARPRAVSLEDAVVSILADRNDAVHIGEIHSELRKQGVRIPGKGVDANIIARIIKEPRIERETGRRGYYRLSHA